MSAQLKRRLAQLRNPFMLKSLLNIGMGIEKESLRIKFDGHLAQTPHPASLGAPLTHPSITTDFSEALMEFITPVFHEATDALTFLENLHIYTYENLEPEELLWISSMPCMIESDDKIPLAQYGTSNVGRLKTLYRSGLSYRYGRAMQTISGIHFNFSFSDEFWEQYQQITGSELPLKDFKTDQYFHLIRNFKRYSWLLIYLFGASPALCKCFAQDNPDHGLHEFDEKTLYAPYGTSLRMGDLGYTSKAQSDLYICYNGLDTYTKGLSEAIYKSYPDYEKFQPETDPDGSLIHKQLNSSVLQIENEFYSTIRPKRVAPSGKKPLEILQEEGVEYVEVRCLDLNPFLPLGIDDTEIRFLTSFLIFCLLRSSPQTNCDEFQRIDDNQITVVKEGRRPGLLLKQDGVDIPLKEWASEILYEIRDIASLMDEAADTRHYMKSIEEQFAKVANPELTPSAKALHRMRESKAPYFRFGMNQSLGCSDYFRGKELDKQTLAEFTEATRTSISDREEIEATDTVDFDTYLKQHNSR